MSKRVKRIAVLAGLLLALLTGYAPVEAKKPSPPPPPPPQDADPAIAYCGMKVKGRTVTYQMMVMDADGGNQTEVPIPDGYFAYSNTLSWSPDGTQLAFMAGDGAGMGIYVVNLDGTGFRKLVGLSQVVIAGLGRTAWAPFDVPGVGGDHPCIAYADRLPDTSATDLFLVTVDTAERIRVTETPGLGEVAPTWSPEGTRLACKVDDRDGVAPDRPDLWGIYDFTDDTWELLQHGGALSGALTDGPSWAKTRDALLWHVWDGTYSDYNVWLVDMDDPTHPVQLTDTTNVQETHPDWSTDDARVAMTRKWWSGGWKYAIEVMDSDGTDLEIVVENAFAPTWRR